MFDFGISLFVIGVLAISFVAFHLHLDSKSRAKSVKKVGEAFALNTLEQRVQLLEILSELESIPTDYGRSLHREVYEAYVQRISDVTSIEQLKTLVASIPEVLSKVSSAKYTVRDIDEFIQIKHRSLV